MSYIIKATYTGDGAETSFEVPFPYITAGDLEVTVEGDAVDFDASTYGTVLIDPAPGNGDEIIIRRVTDIDEGAVTFTDNAPWLASDVNTADRQLLYSIQELNETISSLELGDGNLPDPVGLNRMLVSQSSGPGYVWSQFTVAQVQSLLGISAIVPSPTAGRKFLVTDESTAAYELIDGDTLLSDLGLDEIIGLPDISGNSPNYFVVTTSPTTYALKSPSASRSALGLGTAATKNTGTTVGTIPVLVDVSGSPGLPAVDGSQLTGVQREFDRVVFEGVSLNWPGSSGAWSELLAQNDATLAAKLGGEDTAWYSIQTSSGNPRYIRLTTGTYKMRVELRLELGALTMNDELSCELRFKNATGTTSPNLSSAPYVSTDKFYCKTTSGGALEFGNQVGSLALEGWFKVTTANADMVLEVYITNSGVSAANIDFSLLRVIVEKAT